MPRAALTIIRRALGVITLIGFIVVIGGGMLLAVLPTRDQGWLSPFVQNFWTIVLPAAVAGCLWFMLQSRYNTKLDLKADDYGPDARLPISPVAEIPEALEGDRARAHALRTAGGLFIPAEVLLLLASAVYWVWAVNQDGVPPGMDAALWVPFVAACALAYALGFGSDYGLSDRFRIRALLEGDPDARAWANLTTANLKLYARLTWPNAALRPAGRCYLLLNRDELSVWRPHDSKLHKVAAVPWESMIDARSGQYIGPWMQPGVELRMRTPDGVIRTIDLAPFAWTAFRLRVVDQFVRELRLPETPDTVMG